MSHFLIEPEVHEELIRAVREHLARKCEQLQAEVQKDLDALDAEELS